LDKQRLAALVLHK